MNNIDKIKALADEIKSYYTNKDETNKRVKTEIEATYFEYETLELYYKIFEHLVDKALINISENNIETELVVDNCAVKPGKININNKDYMVTSDEIHRVSITEIDDIYETVFIKKLFLKIIENHPYSFIFDDIYFEEGYKGTVHFTFKTTLDRVRELQDVITSNPRIDDELLLEDCKNELSESKAHKNGVKKIGKNIAWRLKNEL